MSQDFLLNNNFLLLVALMQQQQLQQQQQQQQQQHHHHHHQQNQSPTLSLGSNAGSNQRAQNPRQQQQQQQLHHQQQLHLQQQHLQQQQQQQRDLSLLESLFAMNQEPGDDAIGLIAQRINSTGADVASWFRLRREAERNLSQLPVAAASSISSNSNSSNNSNSNTNNNSSGNNNTLGNLHHHLVGSNTSALLNSSTNSNNTIATSTTVSSAGALNINNNNNNNNATLNNNSISSSAVFAGQQQHQHQQQQQTTNASTLLAKLNVVTTRPNAHILAQKLDSKMIDLLEAFYAINDNPEPGAIEMIARRLNVNIELISSWFEKKRLKLNPFAGPRSPPAKKREGGRVVTFSEYQRSLLEAIFDENNYLHPQEYEELSNLIQVPSRNIKIWFKNRRSKQRNHCKCNRGPESAATTTTTSPSLDIE